MSFDRLSGCRRSAGLVRPRPTSASRKTCSAHTLAALAPAASKGCGSTTVRCGRCAWGCQHCTDRRARTRREESLRPFSRARALCGRSACLAPYVLGRTRPALRNRQRSMATTDRERKLSHGAEDRAAHASERSWLRPPTAVGARRRAAKPERDRSRFLAATSHRAIRGVLKAPLHRALRHMSS